MLVLKFYPLDTGTRTTVGVLCHLGKICCRKNEQCYHGALVSTSGLFSLKDADNRIVVTHIQYALNNELTNIVYVLADFKTPYHCLGIHPRQRYGSNTPFLYMGNSPGKDMGLIHHILIWGLTLGKDNRYVSNTPYPYLGIDPRQRYGSILKPNW